MIDEALEHFIDDGSITEVLYQLKSGKEATVWLCRGRDCLVAAKVYRSRGSHGFDNDVMYRAGRAILEDRVARAVANRSRFGREAARTLWLGHEFETLRTLHRAGADVPEPIAGAEQAFLMSFVERDGRPAPQLREYRPDPMEAREIFERLIGTIELMLSYDVIHGDLSPFNVLMSDDGPVVIDLPQAVDPRSNPSARDLLIRDIENVCRWATKRGVVADPLWIGSDLWDRWERALL
jgi:RIO kinase 1